MRNFMQHEAHSRLAYGRLTLLVRVVRNWRMRKTLKTLRGLSTHHLSDIGLKRFELERLIALPLTHDHAWNSDCIATLQSPSPENVPQHLALLFLRRASFYFQKIQRGTLAAYSR